ncbi:MAG TPA: hypothetical protein ENN90_15660 [Mariniphaga anaerophila]|uniref:Uncharacterized protein n=1 Tax=Mariniphaga anaerophila TaxID=1484053 RepID=A0A831PN59_9BACT|nr:hypothetical protein [Mariniphaga anaerophila]
MNKLILLFLIVFAGFPFGYKNQQSTPEMNHVQASENGIAAKDEIIEEIQARLFLNLYLSQFKRGWKHTFVYFYENEILNLFYYCFFIYTFRFL